MRGHAPGLRGLPRTGPGHDELRAATASTCPMPAHSPLGRRAPRPGRSRWRAPRRAPPSPRRRKRADGERLAGMSIATSAHSCAASPIAAPVTVNGATRRSRGRPRASRPPSRARPGSCPRRGSISRPTRSGLGSASVGGPLGDGDVVIRMAAPDGDGVPGRFEPLGGVLADALKRRSRRPRLHRRLRRLPATCRPADPTRRPHRAMSRGSPASTPSRRSGPTCRRTRTARPMPCVRSVSSRS